MITLDQQRKSIAGLSIDNQSRPGITEALPKLNHNGKISAHHVCIAENVPETTTSDLKCDFRLLFFKRAHVVWPSVVLQKKKKL